MTYFDDAFAVIAKRASPKEICVTNNDVLRRLRYILDINDVTMVSIFEQADMTVSRDDVRQWLKKDDDPDYQSLHDKQMATFLNGLINHLRGKKEGEQPKPEKSLNNNIILRKLKIAFNLQSDEILSVLQLEGFSLSKHELSAFFRKPDHKHYRACKDQVLRNFLQGLQLKYHPKKNDLEGFSWPTLDNKEK